VFFERAVEAEREAFRPCLRCRPELAPGVGRAPVDATEALLSEALRALDEGLPGDDSLEALAARLGVTDRHLRRVFGDALGVSPVTVLQSKRLALAVRLLRDTRLGLAAVAFASGFGSVRRFNDVVRARYGRPPGALRKESLAPSEDADIVLRLDYRPPFDWAGLLAFLRGRAIPGVERVTADSYARAVQLHYAVGTVSVVNEPARSRLVARCSASLVGVLMPLVARLRALFDLDANPTEVTDALGADPFLTPSVALHPGLRVPGSLDPFELAVRTVLGQQVSVAAATTLSIRLCDRLGRPLPEGLGRPTEGLQRLSPTPAALRDASVDTIAGCGIVRTRAEALRALGACFAGWGHTLPSRARFVESLLAIRGIGEWSAQYLCLRGWHDPDAFLAGDLMVRRALGVTRDRDASARAERWRPYRAYATLHLWRMLADKDPAP